MHSADNDYEDWREANDRALQQQGDEAAFYGQMKRDMAQTASRPALTLHTTRKGGIAVVVEYRGDWFGAVKMQPTKIERAVSRYCRTLCVAFDRSEQEGPNHAA